MKNDKNSA